MKKKILYLSITLLFVLCVIFLSNKGERYTGVNYTINKEEISNFKKIVDFYQRHKNYNKLVKKITINDTKEDKQILSVSTWVYKNIKKISDNDNIVDSHPWTIVERKMGAKDQFSDILSVLLVHSDIDSFFISNLNNRKGIFTFFKYNNNWSLIDPYYGIYFLNNKNQFCNLNEYKYKKCIINHLEFGKISNTQLNKIFFDKNFKNLDQVNNYYNFLLEGMLEAKKIDSTNIYERGGRSYIQKPFHRFIFQFQRLIN